MTKITYIDALNAALTCDLSDEVKEKLTALRDQIVGEDAEGNLLEDKPVQITRQVVSQETSSIIRDGMEAVVESEPGIWSELDGYHIGGKTGTAEKDYEDKRYVVSFVGFAPIEDPEVGLLIVLDEADEGTSAVAQRVAAKVLKKTLPYLNLYPED